MTRNRKTNTTKKNKSAPLKGTISRTRRGMAPSMAPVVMSGAVRRINDRFSWPSDDCVTIKVRASRTFTTTAGSSSGGFIIAITPVAIPTSGYVGLGDLNPLLVAMAAAYSRFTVTELMIKVAGVTPITNGGFTTIGYEPDDTNVSAPPTTVSDTTTCVHSDIAQIGEAATISLDPSLYFVDWRPCSNSISTETPKNQAGIVQIYCDGGSSTVANVLAEVEATVHFAGYRKLG